MDGFKGGLNIASHRVGRNVVGGGLTTRKRATAHGRSPDEPTFVRRPIVKMSVPHTEKGSTVHIYSLTQTDVFVSFDKKSLLFVVVTII